MHKCLNFRRKKPISDIVSYLEQKNQGSNLSYNQFYYQFRKLRPLLGEKDVDYLVSYLRSKNAYVETLVDNKNEHMCKLFILY